MSTIEGNNTIDGAGAGTPLRNAGAPVSGVSEVQSLAISGTPTGGSFTLTFDGFTTAAIDYDATAADVQSALEALPNIASGDVTCSGGDLPGTAVTITFGGNLAGLNVPAITTSDSLTGGTSPASAITTTTAGVQGTGRGAPVGAMLLDTTNGLLYENRGTAALPVWERVPAGERPLLTKAADYTVTKADANATIVVTAADVTITLPATIAGFTVTVILAAAGLSAGTGLQIAPQAADKIMGNGFASADNKAAVLAGTGDREGDSITLVGDGADGWYVAAVTGTWTRAA